MCVCHALVGRSAEVEGPHIILFLFPLARRRDQQLARVSVSSLSCGIHQCWWWECSGGSCLRFVLCSLSRVFALYVILQPRNHANIIRTLPPKQYTIENFHHLRTFVILLARCIVTSAHCKVGASLFSLRQHQARAGFPLINHAQNNARTE